MPEQKKKILQGLLSDGMITAYYSYKLIGETEIDLGLVYLNQANTFITAAKTLYYEYEYLFPEKELQAIFFAFGSYNNQILTKVRTKKMTTDEISKAYGKLFCEFRWFSNWISVDLLKDLES